MWAIQNVLEKRASLNPSSLVAATVVLAMSLFVLSIAFQGIDCLRSSGLERAITKRIIQRSVVLVRARRRLSIFFDCNRTTILVDILVSFVLTVGAVV